jgi:hypothetical protein
MELSKDLEYAIQVIELDEERSSCCMPYDCMHHEECGEDGWFCDNCTYRGKLIRAIKHESPLLWQEARRILREREVDLARDIRERAKELESIGDFAAADRLFGSDEEW